MSNIGKNVIHFHFDAVEDFAGFSVTNVRPDNFFWMLTRVSTTSDEAEFYKYVEISNPFFNKVRVFKDAVYQFLILIHKNLSADLYINDFAVAIFGLS